LIGGGARALGMKMPGSFANLDEAFGRTEADEEIQDLLQESRNESRTFLSGAMLTQLSRLSTQLWLHKLYGWTRISLMTERFETPIC
jgi:hypothetical protein